MLNSTPIPLRPKSDQYNPYFTGYINLAFNYPNESLSENGQKVVAFFRDLPESILEYRYAPGKWTLKEVLMHLIDTERVFCYRALVCLRNDKSQLPSMDENHYAANVNVGSRSIKDVCEEFIIVRNSTILLFNHASNEQCALVGYASGFPITAGAIYYMLIGHFYHHQKVIEERYLTSLT